MEEKRIVDGNEVFLNYDPVIWYDEQGNVLGEGTIDEAVALGYFVRSAHVWLVTPLGRLYLQKRSLHVLNNPGKWAEAGGGYVDKGSTPLETAMREIKEELGLSILENAFKHLAEIKQFETLRNGSTGKQLVDIYLGVQDFTEKDISLFGRDVAGGRFVEWREFPGMLEKKEIDFVDHSGEIRIVIAELNKLFGEK